jgi:nucleotide-binding universal stress UspA family protein
MSGGLIVVGVDGSPGAKAAARFAVEEARARGVKLCAVHAYELPLDLLAPTPSVLGMPLMPDVPVEDVREAILTSANAVLDASFEGVDTAGVTLERRPVESPAAPALLDLAQGADLLVLGRRGRGGFAALLLGSVSEQCAHHAPCPVVLVPPEPEA